MRLIGYLGIIACIGLAVSLPVTPKKEEKKEEHPSEDLSSVLEYERYLKEVVEALESDPDFRKKLENAPEADIRSGKIAQELEYVGHNVRSKLDEIKRNEIDRLRKLVKKESFEGCSNGPSFGSHQQHTFEIDDLHKLIKKTSSDLAEADKKRRDEFKQYELQKEFEKNALEKEMDEESKKRYEEELKQKKEKHNKHDKLHHPGNKAQLEEVWEKQDHMDPEDFDPKSFFMMHDIDSNGHWDESEVKALFVKELDKVYQSGIPEDDMHGLISFQEFLDQTKREEFQKDPEWETVDNQPQFTHEEYLEFERKRQEEIQKLIAQGAMPPHPQMPYGYHANGQPNHPNLPPPHYQQHPGVPVHLNQNQVYEHVPQGQQYQQVPQQQFVPQQQHQQGQIHQQVPQYQQQQQQYQQQTQQVPQQQYQQQQQQPQYQQQAQPQQQQAQAPQQQVPQQQVPQQQAQAPQQQVQQQQASQQQVPQQQAQAAKQQVPQQQQNQGQQNINNNQIH
uniref:NUCB1-like N-terminal domain-containing protein n=1 Tax=Megaselia scalaris TaxID=36166 RepID=T1GGX7_MEGSC